MFISGGFIVLLAVVTLGLTVISPMLQYHGWKSTSGTIVRTVTDPPLKKRLLPTAFHFIVTSTFTYSVGGVQYQVEQTNFPRHPQFFDKWDSKVKYLEKDAQSILSAYPAGKTVDVYYDPKKPNAAVIEKAE
jgi:predicted membrane channel-forming protein YqfA (hemolysin III family)